MSVLAPDVLMYYFHGLARLRCAANQTKCIWTYQRRPTSVRSQRSLARCVRVRHNIILLICGQRYATCYAMVYLISGANLHGQWLKSDLVLNGFQNIPKTRKLGVSYDINQFKLIHISWAYNLFKCANKFFLSGSWHGCQNQLVEVPIPEELDYNKKDLLLIGNDYNLFWFDNSLPVMWVLSLDQPSLKKVHLNTHMFRTNETKQLRKDDIITKICLSNINMICLTAHGTVYNGILPSPLQIDRCIGLVNDIKCGYEHCLLLTDAGQVFSWGNGRRLQLGHGNLDNVEFPTLIEALAGIKIIKISAGGWHSLALSECGDVYAWGWNATGQLGISKHTENTNIPDNITSYGLPTLVDIIDENGAVVTTNVKEIACGTQHSAILLEDNSIWTSGCNKYGQTGFPLDNVETLLSFKKSYQCCGYAAIYCGPWATVIESN